MINPIDKNHKPSILKLAQEALYFEEAELTELSSDIDSWLFRDERNQSQWIGYFEDGVLVGAAYTVPERFTDRAWNLLFIGVSPTHQGHGIGTKLLQHIQSQLQITQQRLLLVETLSIPEFEGARKFYNAKGFEKLATISNFYYEGGDKIVFGKKFPNT